MLYLGVHLSLLYVCCNHKRSQQRGNPCTTVSYAKKVWASNCEGRRGAEDERAPSASLRKDRSSTRKGERRTGVSRFISASQQFQAVFKIPGASPHGTPAAMVKINSSRLGMVSVQSQKFQEAIDHVPIYYSRARNDLGGESTQSLICACI